MRYQKDIERTKKVNKDKGMIQTSKGIIVYRNETRTEIMVNTSRCWIEAKEKGILALVRLWSFVATCDRG